MVQNKTWVRGVLLHQQEEKDLPGAVQRKGKETKILQLPNFREVLPMISLTGPCVQIRTEVPEP